ncbi:asparagine synthase-related protein [Alkalimonas sp.]|uniref:asparagine synthase-related protein n=1 Tax=Alkalimonas sp. TaxID=1872453 RepID=UPI00263B2971|nr:asparagine synthase-related protein [Alkalimonas sp.]MCC5827190.1 hypothetical protein [Alkalimonas sp.]
MNHSVIRLGSTAAQLVSNTSLQYLASQPQHSSGLLSMQSNQSVLSEQGNLLLVLGMPLPAITTVPTSWQQACAELPQHEGVFAAIYWDSSAEKLVICTDILGLQPLYWKKNADHIVLSDKTTAFTGEANHAGWGAFIALGYPLGRDTLTQGVNRLDPAALLVIDGKNLNVEQRCYWSFDQQAPEADTESLFSALQASVDLTLAACSQQEHAILLSGGYDSRLIAFLLSERKLSLQATIVSHYDENLDADARFAKAIACHLAIPYCLKRPQQDFFSSPDYLEYLMASDAEIPSLYLFISQVGQFIDAPVVWEGLLPGKTLKASEPDFATFQRAHIKGFEHAIWRSAELVFGHEQARAMWQAFLARWHEEQACYPDTGKGTALFNLAHRARNRVGINPFKVYQQKAQVCMPGMSRDYLQAAMSIDHAKKQHHQLYQQIFRRYYPEALQFPIAHGSTVDRMQASSLSSYLFQFALSCHNRLNQHPRMLRWLGIKPAQGFSPSRFLAPEQLLQNAGTGLNPAFLAKLAQGESLPEPALRLLFYWQSWQMLRQKPVQQWVQS